MTSSQFVSKWRSGAALLLSVSLFFALVTISLHGEGTPAEGMELSSGQAWFVSLRTGQAVLLDGTGTRVGKVDVAKPGEHVVLTQIDSGALIVNKAKGTVTRVDASSWKPKYEVVVERQPDESLAIVSNGKRHWLITNQARRVQELDATNGNLVGQGQLVPGPITSAVATTSGQLWTTDSRGNVRFLDARGKVGSPQSNKEGGLDNARLVLVRDRPYVVDLQAHLARPIDSRHAGTSSVCMDFDDDSLVSDQTKTRRIIAVMSRSGLIAWSSVEGGPCENTALDGAAAGRYGQPVEHGNRIFVPDFVNGTVIVVDPSHTDSPVVGRVALGLPSVKVRLTSHNHHLWFDDPEGDSAGVITDDLLAVATSKTQGPDGATPNKVNPATPLGSSRVGCQGSPVTPQLGQLTTFFAVTDPGLGAPTGFEWAFPQGNPSKARERIAATAFSAPGKKQITVKVSFGSASRLGSCEVEVGAQSVQIPPPDANTPLPFVEMLPSPRTSDELPSNCTATTSFSVTPERIVTGTLVTFTDTTEGSHRILGWTAIGAASSSGSMSSTFTASWDKPGVFDVALTTDIDRPCSPVARHSIVVASPLAVPDVRGMTQAQARAALLTAGFDVDVGLAVDSVIVRSRIVDSSPPAGTQIASGSTVTVHPSTGNGTLAPVSWAPVFSSPTNMASDANGNLYIYDEAQHRIVRVDEQGNRHTIAGNGQTAGVGIPQDDVRAVDVPLGENVGHFTTDSHGNLYFTEMQMHPEFQYGLATYTRRIDAVTGRITSCGEFFYGNDAIADIDVDSRGRIYTTDVRANNTSVSDGSLEFPYNGWKEDGTPVDPYTDIEIGPDDSVYSPRLNDHTEMNKFVNGAWVRIAGGGTRVGDDIPALEARFTEIGALEFGPSGNLYFVADGAIYVLDDNNYVHKVVSMAMGEDQGVGSLSFDKQGRVYFIKTGPQVSNDIGRIE